MKILIIGAKGMLGQELGRVFADGNEVLRWDREEIDITQFENSKLKIQNSKPDLVINAAAYNDVDGAERKPELANAVNGYAVGNLAKVCSELSIPLVHYSTEYVFNGEEKSGYKEGHKPEPVSAYGRSKFLGEQELQNNASQYYLIRLSRMFGRPALSKEAKKSFVEVMLKLSETKKELEVVDEELSCPTYAPDLARQTKLLVEQKKPFGIYHCVNPGGVTWFGFAEKIFEFKGLSVKLKAVPGSHFPRPALRPKYGVLLNTKLPEMRPWEEALKEFLTSSD